MKRRAELLPVGAVKPAAHLPGAVEHLPEEVEHLPEEVEHLPEAAEYLPEVEIFREP